MLITVDSINMICLRYGFLFFESDSTRQQAFSDMANTTIRNFKLDISFSNWKSNTSVPNKKRMRT